VQSDLLVTQNHAILTLLCSFLRDSETAEDGGHTNFKNVGVHVAPVKGDALFFSYIDPHTSIMDTGLTMHSGCPVYSGDKKIVTQWIRLGVDQQNPYTLNSHFL
jgi:hypothetical protein